MTGMGNGIGGASSAPPIDSLSIEREYIRHTHQNLTGVFAAVPIGAALLLYILKDQIGSTHILAWFVLTLIGVGLRLWFYLAFRRHSREAFDTVFWGGLQSLVTILAGLLWGAVPLVAYSHSSFPEQMFINLMVGGMTAGATYMYAAMPRTAQAFLATALLPMAGLNFAMGTIQHLPVGIMGVIYYFVLVVVTRNNTRIVQSAVKLAFENMALAEEMRKARDGAESAAQKLRVEIAERVKAEKELLSIMEAQPDMLYVYNLKGALIKWNSTLQKFCGLAPEQLMERPATEFVCEEDGPLVIEGIKEVFEKGLASIEVRIIRHDGALVPHLCNGAVWKNEAGEPIGFIGVAKDISERKKAEAEVIEAEARFRQLSNAAFEGIVINVEGKIVDCNNAFAQMFGYTPEEIIGTIPVDLSPPESQAVIMDHIRRGSEEVYDVMGRKKDGTLFPIEIQGRSILHHGVKARVTAVRDISERKAAEEKLKTAKDAAEEATKLKDKFVTLVSHDLKTPLASIIGFLHLLRHDYAASLHDDEKSMFDRAVESGDAMMRLIEDLLKISRFKTGQLKLNRQFFDAEYLGAMIAANYSHLAMQKGIEIENTIPANSRMYGDKILLTEAVQNLVTNAIKFCKSGDRITISLANGDAPAICVRDTGPGIQPNLLDDLFKFEKKTSTTGTAGETGTGFGLPLAKNIMELHGGDLTVHSQPGNGCAINLTVPYVRPRILLVDDERNSRFLQVQRLRELNAEIVEADNGQDALNVMAGVRPHLVITDIKMPVMDGLELLKRIKSGPDTKDIPVIVMSGEYGMEIRDTVFKFGGDDFVTKNKTDKIDFIPRVRRFIG